VLTGGTDVVKHCIGSTLVWIVPSQLSLLQSSL